jgi:hypothetical protein
VKITGQQALFMNQLNQGIKASELRYRKPEQEYLFTMLNTSLDLMVMRILSELFSLLRVYKSLTLGYVQPLGSGTFFL